MFVRSIICVTMRDLAQMIFSINNKSWKGMLRMLNKNMGKSALMTALITGSVIWGGHGSTRGGTAAVFIG